MSAAVDFATLRLVRVCIGKIELNNLQADNVIEMDSLELDLR